MGFSFNKVRYDLFAFKVFLGKLSKSIASNFSDKARIHSTSAGPDRNIGRTSTGREHDFTKGVSAAKQFRVRANEHIPGKVTENA
jgi:hypothetical protein